MPQKSRKAKKKDVGTRKQNLEAAKNDKGKNFAKGFNLKGAENLTVHFSHNELQEIKNVIKCKDLSNLPLVLAAVIVNKFHIVKDLVQKGCNVNETGLNHVTALMWAVKCKSLDIIDYLLANGADPTTKNDSGDNILFMALENKQWEEENYIKLWNQVKNVSFVDVDFMGKNGRNMVHTTIRREWKNMLDILIAGKANINTENPNGMTPLMLASYLNNFNIVNALLQAKADVLKEDSNGCTALCYAISYVINKNAQVPHLVVDKLVVAFHSRGVAFKDFFKSRIDSILHSIVKQNKTGQPILDTKTFIIHYVLRFTESRLKTVLEVDIFRRIAQVAQNYIMEPLQMVKFLTIINEVMRYCECCFGAGGLEKHLLESFVINGVPDLCLTVLQKYGFNNTFDYDFISTTFGPILTVCLLHSEGKSWLNNNISKVLPFHKNYLIKNPIEKNSDDCRTIRNNEKIAAFNMLIDSIIEGKQFPENAQQEASELNPLQQDSQKSNDVLKSDNSVKETKQERKSNPKKTKRRAKALKAKIAKIKSADLAERLNQNGKKILEQKCISESDTSIVKNLIKSKKPEEGHEKPKVKCKAWSKHSAWEQIWLVDNRNDPLTQEFNQSVHILENQFITDIEDKLFNIDFEQKLEFENEPNKEFKSKEEEENNSMLSLYLEWKEDNLPSPTLKCSNKIKNKKQRLTEFHKSTFDLKEKPSEEEIQDLLTCTLNYLSGLLKKIIITYQKHWERDKERDKDREDVLMNDHGDVTDQHEKQSSISSAIEKLETEHIEHVQKQFDKLINRIKNSADKNFTLCSKIIDKLEGILLNHKIRGKSIIQDTVMQVVNMNDDLEEALSNICETDQDMSVPKYVENLLHQTRSGNIVDDDDDDDTFTISYLDTEKFEKNLEKHPDALYLQEILALSPKPPLNSQKLKRDKMKTLKSAYHLVPSILNICEENEEEIITKREEITKQEASTSKYRKRQTLQETLLAMPKIDDPNKLLEVLEINHCNSECQSLMENTTSRWCNTIRSLQMMKCYQILLNGEIRISHKEKDDSHIISNGGNFSPVILGLDASDRPLAVKRIRKDNSVCKIMKNLLNPLLGLRNTNLLHYFSCNYEENELVLATPLCEYNMGEYIMMMKQSPNMYISSIDIVKQFLTGLRFLHDRLEPIIHGNLKPSNIFIDLNGIVRIAEFGMHKALYTLTDAPNTSIIWFSRETLAAFKDDACIMCTCASDIQVAGMLIHFMLTAGKHPYGEIMQEILKNLERAIPQLATTDVDLHDLISWMLLYEPGERPSINQVLSHVFFWTTDRKWRFILTCSGVSSHGTALNIPLNELHSYINIVAARENIKGRWINITKTKFPNLSYSKDDQDSITGLLRFIRNCMQNQVPLHINLDLEFRNFILSSFPALPLSLFRILECSQWLNHRVLQPFTTVDSLSA